METCIVTGGAGFIGSNFIKYVFGKRKDIRIINIDKLTYAGNLSNLERFGHNENYVFIKADICNRRKIRQIFLQYKPDYVINFAAESHVDRSIGDSEVFIYSNVLGTQNLLNTSREVKLRKFIQISTDEVYGSYKDGEYFNEESPLAPANPYAASKAGADMLAMAFHKTYDLPVIITRCTNNFGPNQHVEKLIPLVIRHCLDGEKIPVYGDGRNVRDWLHVYDHCSAVYKVLEKGKPGQIYNISADCGKENIEIIKLIIKELGKLLETGDPRRENLNERLIAYVEDRKGHDRRYAINSDKLRQELDWRPEISFEDGIKQTLKWYLNYFSKGVA